jgi:predicted DNA-binding transcriptional regulator YafY
MDIERLYRLHKLIQREATGTPDELAERFCVKRRQIFYLLDELKSFGTIFKYDSTKYSYAYKESFDFFEKIGIESLSGKGNKYFLQKILKNFVECSDNCTE